MSTEEAILAAPAIPARPRANPIRRICRAIATLRAPRDRGPLFYRLLLWCCRNSH